jgi:hypothetical protein
MSIRRRSEFVLAAVLALTVLSTSAALGAPSDDDSLAQYRERFKQGFDRYTEGAFAEAIGLWEPIYRELGEHDGYRLAYDLGVAYAQLGDATRAAERLQSFLGQLDDRRARGQPLAAAVIKEEADARARIVNLTASKGRIEIEPSATPPAVKVDAAEPRLAGFVAWVAPGTHRLTFSPGTADEETVTVTVKAGEVVVVTPKAKPGTVAAPSPTPAPAQAAANPPAPAQEQPGGIAPPSLQLVILSGGVTAAAGVAGAVLYVDANNLHDRFVAQQKSSANHTISSGDRASFDTARTAAYVTIGCAAGLAALTGGLATWYALGPKREHRVAPLVGFVPGATTFGLAGDF